MRLDDVASAFEALDFPLLTEEEHPARSTVVAARAAVERAVVDDDFLLDCVSLELRLLEAGWPHRGLVPFLTLPRTGIRFAFGYWPPHGGPGPHEHTAWTITGVLRNELEVRTYDRAESYRRGKLVEKNLFAAPEGKVGFMYEPGIHAPRNPTLNWSLSIHIASPRDGLPLADHAGAPAALQNDAVSEVADQHDAYASVLAARQRQRFVRELASIVASAKSTNVRALLATCFEIGTSMTRAHVEKLAGGSVDTCEHASQAFVLRRVHPELALHHRLREDAAELFAETARGLVSELAVSPVAHEAVGYVAKHPRFDVDDLPGDLDRDERVAVGQALEETGLFERVRA